MPTPTMDLEPPLETAQHWHQMLSLVSTLEQAWAHRRDFHVAGKLRVLPYEGHSWRGDVREPDVVVAVATERRERRCWIVDQEGKPPDVVIELVAPNTETADRVVKRQIYATVLKIPEYIIFDPALGKLDAFELCPKTHSYLQRELDANGRVFLPSVGLFLGVDSISLW
ncbi:MAG TPA: Uma2 family endonuclease, partial [Polyangiaceae bacterium]